MARANGLISFPFSWITAVTMLALCNISGGWGGEVGLGVLEHPQLSSSRYPNRAITLIQQLAQNSYS